MSDTAIISATVVTVVALAGACLAIVFWLAAQKLDDRRLFFVSLGFGTLFLRGLFSIYSIQSDSIHHETSELIGALFDIVMVALFAAPFWLRGR